MLDKPNARIYIRLNKIKQAPDAGKSGGLIRQRNRNDSAGKLKTLNLRTNAGCEGLEE